MLGKLPQQMLPARPDLGAIFTCMAVDRGAGPADTLVNHGFFCVAA